MGVLLLTATALEQAELVSCIEEAVRQSVAGRQVTAGSVAGAPVTVVETGLGAVNTAHALTWSFQSNLPHYVLQIGVGGAYSGSALRVGDVAVASEENYGDVGVRTADGWQGAQVIGIPLIRSGESEIYNRFPLDPEWVGRCRDLLSSATWENPAPAVGVGAFVTVQECSGTQSLGAERSARFGGAVCENMEGAAAAHVCRIYSVPFIEVRAMSNIVDDRQTQTWDLPGAAAVAQEAAMHLVKGMEW